LKAFVSRVTVVAEEHGQKGSIRWPHEGDIRGLPWHHAGTGLGTAWVWTAGLWLGLLASITLDGKSSLSGDK